MLGVGGWVLVESFPLRYRLWGEYGVHGSMQIVVVEWQGFPDALFEGEPGVFNRVEIGGVGGQEFLGAVLHFR